MHICHRGSRGTACPICARSSPISEHGGAGGTPSCIAPSLWIFLRSSEMAALLKAVHSRDQWNMARLSSKTRHSPSA
eukprot:3820855-Prymnesium_polylepis.1